MVYVVVTVLYSSRTLGCMWSFGMYAFFYSYELTVTWFGSSAMFISVGGLSVLWHFNGPDLVVTCK